MAENEEISEDKVPEEPTEDVSVNDGSEKKEKKSKSAREKSWWNRNMQAGVIGFLSALLVCVLVVGSFAIGYAVGDRGDHRAPNSDSRTMQGIGQVQQGVGQRLEGLQEDLGVNIIRGKVTSVSADKITVNSSQGDQTIKITSSTITSSDKEIAEGDQVIVMAKEAEGQEAEAVSIAVQDGNKNINPGNKDMQPGPGNMQQQGQSNI